MSVRPIGQPSSVVVGVSGGGASLRAVAYAAGVAARLRAQLLVAHARPAPLAQTLSIVDPLTLAACAAAVRDSDREACQLIVRELDALCMPATLLVMDGDPYRCLRSLADEYAADLVVVGAPRRKHRLFSSVPSRLVRDRHWPVTVVP